MKWSDHYWYKIPCMRARVEEIVSRAKGAASIVEVGCNEGFLSQALKEVGLNVTSVDNDPKMVGAAKNMFGIDVVRGDINALPFKDEEFDLAIGGEVLEHLLNPGAGLRELFRVAKKRVIISLPVGSYWLGEPTHQWGIGGAVIEHDRGLNENMVKKLLVLEFYKRGDTRGLRRDA